MKLFELFLVFARIGAFTFGGGYAMIPLIQKETVETKKWITDDDILEIIAIAESTPGPIAINSATFVGCLAVFFDNLSNKLRASSVPRYQSRPICIFRYPRRCPRIDNESPLVDV